jgi:hypothetical protein
LRPEIDSFSLLVPEPIARLALLDINNNGRERGSLRLLLVGNPLAVRVRLKPLRVVSQPHCEARNVVPVLAQGPETPGLRALLELVGVPSGRTQIPFARDLKVHRPRCR